MDLCDYDNRTALHIAVSDKQEYIVDFLLDKCNLKEQACTMKDRYFIKTIGKKVKREQCSKKE